ncbi:MAG: hypothetical protein GKR87_00125 [Kiritimatiellae bacterium]|nr:hypothetical protein [Kiritimatiellia bacterium]
MSEVINNGKFRQSGSFEFKQGFAKIFCGDTYPWIRQLNAVFCTNHLG